MSKTQIHQQVPGANADLPPKSLKTTDRGAGG